MAHNQITLDEVYKILLELREKINKMDAYLSDLEFARRTEEAYKRHEEGDFIELSDEKFLEELKRW